MDPKSEKRLAEYRETEDMEDDLINLGEYFLILRPLWWKIIGLSLSVGIVVLLWMFTKPNLYRASAVITPSVDEGKQNPAFGALASFGVSVGGPSKVEDLETLFKSNDLTARVFQKHNLWPICMPGRFDPKSGSDKTGWIDRLLGKRQEAKQPGPWDAIRIAQGMLLVSANKKNGTLSISFESPSPQESANIVQYYLDEAKNRLQEEAFGRANMNKKFIESQISKTVDALTRERLYSLYGQEVEREMMARNREQFGFRVIDSPRVPDRKSRPVRSKAAGSATVISFIAWSVYFVIRGKKGMDGKRADDQ